MRRNTGSLRFENASHPVAITKPLNAARLILCRYAPARESLPISSGKSRILRPSLQSSGSRCISLLQLVRPHVVSKRERVGQWTKRH